MILGVPSKITHIADLPRDNEQVCARCGYVLTNPGETPFETSALVMVTVLDNGARSLTVVADVVENLCRIKRGSRT